MNANPILLQMKYARVTNLFAQRMQMPLDEALGVFYHSLTYRMMREGVSDLHCMSDAYLAEELELEYTGVLGDGTRPGTGIGSQRRLPGDPPATA